ncbi:hypothetical protein CRG98_014353 [Punica granatum]|uniref:Uncharacterized protein n=1 Tax=Punica granatum TaxID=22663 RepID=A0A2I0K9K0_PUNGR|nr:hypothetical protein CRG98_014353 [Punica granatum]
MLTITHCRPLLLIGVANESNRGVVAKIEASPTGIGKTPNLTILSIPIEGLDSQPRPPPSLGSSVPSRVSDNPNRWGGGAVRRSLLHQRPSYASKELGAPYFEGCGAAFAFREAHSEGYGRPSILIYMQALRPQR